MVAKECTNENKKKKNREITQVTIQSELCRKRLTRATKMIFLLLFILSGLSFNKDCESNSAILKTISRVWGLLAAYSGKASMTVQTWRWRTEKDRERENRERERRSVSYPKHSSATRRGHTGHRALIHKIQGLESTRSKYTPQPKRHQTQHVYCAMLKGKKRQQKASPQQKAKNMQLNGSASSTIGYV